MTRGRTRSWEIHLECVPCRSEGLTLWGSKAKEGEEGWGWVGGGARETSCRAEWSVRDERRSLRSTLKADDCKSPCQTAETFSHVSRHRRLYYPSPITAENRSKQLNGCCRQQITPLLRFVSASQFCDIIANCVTQTQKLQVVQMWWYPNLTVWWHRQYRSPYDIYCNI